MTKKLSQCPGCFSMTHTLKNGDCGKCKTSKDTKAYVQTQYRHQCACGHEITKEKQKEIDDLWRKTGMKEMGIKGLKKDDIVVPKDFPMGVSEWLRIGKKYGYCDYWVKEALESQAKMFLECLPEEAEKYKEDTTDLDFERLRGHNICRNNFLSNAKKKGLI